MFGNVAKKFKKLAQISMRSFPVRFEIIQIHNIDFVLAQIGETFEQYRCDTIK